MRKSCYKNLGLALCVSPFAFSSTTSFAQDSALEEQVVERIVVNATRTETPWIQTPAAITRTEVEEQLPGQRSDAAELLTGIAGLQVDTRYNFAQDTRITLRGFGARAAFGVRGVRLRLDGIPLSMPDGQAQTSSILLDEPAYVEVLRGPLAAIYGNAAGGVIDFRSRTPTRSEALFDISQGSAQRDKKHFRGVYRRGEQAVSLDYTEFSSAGDRPLGAVDREQWGIRGYHETDSFRVIVRLDDNQAPDIEDPLALTEAAWRANPNQVNDRAYTFRTRKSISHQQQSITLEGLQTPWQLALWQGEREIEQFLPFAGDDPTSSGAVIDLNREFSGISATYTLNPLPSKPWQLVLAADLESQEDTRFGYVNDQGTIGDLRRDETGTVENTDVSIISNYALGERWFWTAGLRRSELEFAVVDRYINAASPDDSGNTKISEWSWSQGLSYQLSSTTSIYSSLGRGFESPTLTEMAYRNEGPGLNIDLQASAITQYELGMKWLTPSLRGQFNLFKIDSEDDIVVDQSNDGRTTYRNAAETVREGVELELQWTLSEHWSWQSSYTWLQARYAGNVAEAGKRLPGLARAQWFQRINWRPLGDSRLQVQVQQQYRSRVASNDTNTEYAPAATVYDFSLSGEYWQDGWRIQPWFRIDNVTDKKYVGSVVVNQGSGRSFEPAPGRVWLVGFTAQFSL